MLLCLEISVLLLLLGHSAVRPAAGDCSVPGLVNDLRGACVHGLSHTVQTTQDVKVRLQRAAGKIATLHQTTQKIMTGQQQIIQVMQLLQVQVTETQSRVTAHQEQLTELQQQLTDVQQQKIAPQEQVTEELTTLQPSCPDDWSRHRQTCYLISPQLTTWDKAASICAALHPAARLASIHDSASNQHVRQLSGSKWWLVWIGLSRPAPGANWSWSDGTPLDYTNGLPGPSPNAGSALNCVLAGGNGPWLDHQCDDRYRALCQIRLG